MRSPMTDLVKRTDDLRDMLVGRATDTLKAGGTVYPTVAIIITKDPLTGTPIPGEDGLGLLIMVCASLEDEADKDRYAEMLRVVALAGEAEASVIVADVYALLTDKTIAHSTRVSEHADRQNALAVWIERSDGTGTSEINIYRHDQGTIELDEPKRYDGPVTHIQGRFVVLPREAVPPDLLPLARGWLRMKSGSSMHWEKM